MPLVVGTGETELSPAQGQFNGTFHGSWAYIKGPNYSFFSRKSCKTTEEVEGTGIGKTTERKGIVEKHVSK